MSLVDGLKRWLVIRLGGEMPGRTSPAPRPTATPAPGVPAQPMRVDGLANDAVVAGQVFDPAQPADAPFTSRDDDAAYPNNRRLKARRSARPGTRVLVVDDSSTIVALLRKLLQQNGFDTLEAGDAESAIEIARSAQPELIFLDIVLPGMNGFAALRALRRDPITSSVPIIMISGNAAATEQFYVQRIGADDFMKKPFSRAEVFSRIELLLDDDGIPCRASGRHPTRFDAGTAQLA